MDKTTAQYWFNNTTQLVRMLKHRNTKNEIIQLTKCLPSTASMPQRLWHIINNTWDIPGCKTCSDLVSWDKRYKKYKTFCGNPRCPNIDEDVIKKKKQNIDYDKATLKRQQTCLALYGHKNFLASDIGKQSVSSAYNAQDEQQKIDRYKKVATSRKSTIQHKYGVDNISYLSYLSPNILTLLNDKQWLIDQHHNQKKSAQQIGQELSITSASAIIRSYLKKHDIESIDVRLPQETLTLLNDKQWLIDQHHNQKKSQTLMASELYIKGGATVIGRYLRKYNIPVLNPTPVSVGEIEIANWIESKGVQILRNDRKLIAPLELDIVIPDYNIAIEYCGLYWHSEQQGKDKYYHQKKYDMCNQQGIQLLTIYEDEWQKNNTQVKSKILSLLHIDPRPIVYARKTKIMEVSTSIKKDFLEVNHIQGNGPSSINYGAYCQEGELVAIMSFTKHGSEYTLTRYATSRRVVGGFSKILAHFKKKNMWTKIISFADLRWSNGNLYSATGWVTETIIPPDYYYSPNGHDRFHKFNYRRKYLKERLKHFDPTLSETMNCDNNNILRIWDCGKIRFVCINT